MRIEKLDDENLPDFEKSFDSISHDFMFNRLKCFNFGSDIINWITFLYNFKKLQNLYDISNKDYLKYYHIDNNIHADWTAFLKEKTHLYRNQTYNQKYLIY